MKSQMRDPLVPLIVAVAAIASGSARADWTAIMFDSTQIWGLSGGVGVFGWQFTPQSDIQVTALGLYDSPDIYGGYYPGDALRESHPIAIWDVSNHSSPLVSAVVPWSTMAPLADGFRYVSTAPVTLAAGGNYVIAALYLDTADLMTGAPNSPGFVLTVGPGIGFHGYQWSNSTVLDFPGNNEPRTQLAFGPNFTYTVVPEPSTLTLCGLVAATVFGLRRSRASGRKVQ